MIVFKKIKQKYTTPWPKSKELYMVCMWYNNIINGPGNSGMSILYMINKHVTVLSHAALDTNSNNGSLKENT